MVDLVDPLHMQFNHTIVLTFNFTSDRALSPTFICLDVDYKGYRTLLRCVDRGSRATLTALSERLTEVQLGDVSV